MVGKGGAVMLGARRAEGDLIGFVDADGATLPPAFDDLVLGDPIAGTRTFVSGVAVTFNGTAADGIAMNIAACDGHEENGCV